MLTNSLKIPSLRFHFLLLTIAITLLIKQSSCLPASQVSNYCHCDITTSYCDFGCCCDLDCSNNITTECYQSKSSIFCLNSSYYFKIDPTLTPSGSASLGCYYYNQSTYLQQQVSMSNKQAYAYAAKLQNQIALASSQTAMNRGYQLGDPLALTGVSSFSFFDGTGNCITTGLTSTFTTSIQWRQNVDISCSGSSNSINLFDNVLGRSIYSFSGTTALSVLIPKIDGSFNQAIVYVIIGRYGQNNVQYVQDVRTVGVTSSDNTVRTLRIRFVDPLVDLQQEDSWPSFFPQIPYDIFYPIYQIAYSYR